MLRCPNGGTGSGVAQTVLENVAGRKLRGRLHFRLELDEVESELDICGRPAVDLSGELRIIGGGGDPVRRFQQEDERWNAGFESTIITSSS